MSNAAVEESMLMSWLSLVLMATVQAEPQSVRRDEYNDCGQIALYCAARLNGIDVSRQRVSELTGPPVEGVGHNLATLAEVARALGLDPVAVSVAGNAVGELPLPCIAHMKYSSTERRAHFLVVMDCSPRGVLILDPPHEPMRLAWNSFLDAFAGNVLCFPRTESERRKLAAMAPSPRGVRLLRVACLLNVALVAAIAVTFVRPKAPAPQSAPSSRNTWSKYLAAISGWIVVMVAAAWYVIRGPASPIAEAALTVTPHTIDLGARLPGEYPVEIRISNNSCREVRLRSVNSTCACTSIEHPESLPPGGSSHLKAKAHISPGVGNAELTVFSDDPAGPQHVSLHWISPERPLIVPASVVAQRARQSDVYTGQVRLRYLGFAGMKAHPAVHLLSKDTGIRVVAAGRPRPVEDGDLAWEGRDRLFEIPLDVIVDPPPQGDSVETVVWLEVTFGGAVHKVPLPIAVRSPA